jgi:hypothetical protein
VLETQPQRGRAADEPDWKGPLGEAFGSALEYLEGLPARPLGSSASVEELRVALGGPLPEAPSEPREVIAALAAAAEPGLVATPSGRFFGFVIGGAAPAAPRLRPLVAGVELADSWATDAHMWLNVPYDSGLVFCAHPRRTGPP